MNDKLEHIKPTIQRKSRQLAGKKIKCHSCSCPDAWICEESFRFYVRCPDCASFYLLKEQWLDKKDEM